MLQQLLRQLWLTIRARVAFLSRKEMSKEKFLTWLPWQLGIKQMPGVLLQVLKRLFFWCEISQNANLRKGSIFPISWGKNLYFFELKKTAEYQLGCWFWGHFFYSIFSLFQ
jgi:hypothetical protein